MCGIAGSFAYGRAGLGIGEAELVRMTDALAHRGPDDRGIHFDPERGIALGHRRLSIIDLAAGHQPMANDDESCWIVYNGEVYNHAALRAELEQRGWRFKTRCDTEVILRLYEAEGDACVERLRGMFAFAIWDRRRRRLFLARDRIGIKPLYWCDLGGRFTFASEPRALFAHPDVVRRLDRASLYHHLSFLSTPAPRTMFEGIHKLEAGHRAEVSEAGVRIERYWDALDAPRHDPSVWRDEAALAGEVKTRLRDAIEMRMMSDVPFGVFLSGGIDSSANVALMSECTSLPVNTFTVTYAGADVAAYNEAEWARRVAQQFGTAHHEVAIDQRSVLDYLPEFIAHQDEPVADPVCIPLYYVSKLAREHGIKVIQVGEGSDELFLGYSMYLKTIREWQLLAPLRAAPRGVRRALHAALSPGLRAVGHRFLHYDEMLRRLVDEEIFWGGAIALGDREKAEFMPGAGWSSWETLARFYGEIDRRWPDADLAQRMTYVELRQRLPELLLARVDKITMAVGLEARVPFLDHRFVEFVLRLPLEVKLRGGHSKAILKRALAGVLPDDLLHRKKVGFPAPVSQWAFAEPFGSHLRAKLAASPLVRDGLIDGAAVRRVVDAHFARRADHGTLLWILFDLTLWYEHWIDAPDARVAA